MVQARHTAGGKHRRKLNPFRFGLVVSATLLLIVALCVGGYFLSMIITAPALSQANLTSGETSIIYDKDGHEITQLFGAENRTPIKIQKVPKLVINAVLATEDVRFYDHIGVDFRALARAGVAQVTGGWGSQGASTITQQLVKLTFLTPEKTLKRKVQEAWLALQLERKYSKDEILQMYLNRIFYGHNAYGIQAAAQTYFGKNVEDLTLPEAAMLAGIPQAPSRYSPFRNPEVAKARRQHVLENMAKYGFITQEQANTAMADNLSDLNKTTSAKEKSVPYQYFIEYVQEQLEGSFGSDKLYSGGLKIYTTLDPVAQQAAEAVMNDKAYFPKSLTDANGVIQPQAAAIFMEPGTGYLRAIVGGRGQSSATKRGLNRASQSHRQPGSSFKPIIAYGPAIEFEGKAPSSVVDDAPVSFGDYSPKNSGGGYRGLTSLTDALTRSVNVVAVKLLETVTPSKAITFARKLGISSDSLDPEKDANLATALGGLSQGVTPLEMVGAYGAFANNGMYVKPSAIIRVEDRYGNVLYNEPPAKRQAMKETTAYLLTDMLTNAVKYGTGSRAKMSGWEVAGKTGTTNEGKDIWFAGYTSRLVGVVWLGHDQPKAMPQQFGGLYPAKIWKQIMTKALAGQKDKGFTKPDGLVYATVCKISGRKPSSLCPTEDIVTEVFAKGTVPSKVCDVHVKVKISAASGKLATDKCPDVVEKVFIKASASGVKMAGMAPTEYCTLHGGSATSKGVVICTDPSHNGELVLANVPGPGETGGCPLEFQKTQTFAPGEAPTAKCTVPEHQITPAGPTTPTVDNPVVITPNETTGPDSPEAPPVIKPKKVIIKTNEVRQLW